MEVGWSFPNSGGSGGGRELETTNPLLYALYRYTDLINIEGEATYEEVT